MEEILKQFGIDLSATVVPVGNGHINKTYKVSLRNRAYILQRINNKVFTKPEIIASNLQYAQDYLSINHPEYLFVSPLKATSGATLVYDAEDFPWRLYPFIEGTFTIDEATDIKQAREGAKAFALFAKKMQGCNLVNVQPTIERFHDLSLRYDQFTAALQQSEQQLIQSAENEIAITQKHADLVEQYRSMIESGVLKPGVFHNDTKINNVLFDKDGASVVVIDLDTVMEGYFIYDLGDLVRTLVSPVSEEEKDLGQIHVREAFYDAVVDGYMSELGDSVSAEERRLAGFAGPMMTYIMALRFLADYLRGNTYYHVSYPEQNLVRAKNQLNLLEKLRDLRR